MDGHIILRVTGGYGKNLLATPAVRSLAEAGNTVTVVASHPRAWIQNPYVREVIPLGAGGMYERIRDADEYLDVDPYRDRRTILHLAHVAETWADLAGADRPEEIAPTVVMSGLEAKAGGAKVPMNAVILQAQGGVPDERADWVRDIPWKTARRIVEELKGRNMEPFHLRHDKQPHLPGATPLVLKDPREAYPWLARARGRILMDSFAQHAAAGLNLPSVVLWPIGDRAVAYGYDIHHNVTVHPPAPPFRPPLPGLLEEYPIGSGPEACPYADDLDALFDPGDICDIALNFPSNQNETSNP